METQEETKKNMNLEDAKAEVLVMINQGISFREIAKKEFSINGHIKKFGISEISKIKNESDPQKSTQAKDLDKALVFKLFKIGKTPTEVLIETGYTFDFVKHTHEEFLEFEQQEIVPKWFKDYMYTLASRVKKVKTLSDVYYSLVEAVKSHERLLRFTYLCKVCSKPIQFDEDEWKDVKQYLRTSGWGHSECIDSKNRRNGQYIFQR